MPIAVVKPTRAELDRCVARFRDLERCDTGLPDMQLPEGRRAFLNVLGFSQPKAPGQYSPFGDMAPAAVSHLKAGFGIRSSPPGRAAACRCTRTTRSRRSW